MENRATSEVFQPEEEKPLQCIVSDSQPANKTPENVIIIEAIDSQPANEISSISVEETLIEDSQLSPLNVEAPEFLPCPVVTDDQSENLSVFRTIRRIQMLSLAPAELMVVPVTFCEIGPGNFYDALVDSGAEVNLLSKTVLSDTDSMELLEPFSGDVKGFGGRRQAVLGAVQFSPVIHGRRFSLTKFFVVPANTVDESVVLGYDFLRDENITVDCPLNLISISGPDQDSTWEFYPGNKDTPCNQMYYGLPVVAEQSVQLEKGMPDLVPVSVNLPEEQIDFECPMCLGEDLPEFYYDGIVGSKGLKGRACGIPGLFSTQESSVLIKCDSPTWIQKGDLLGRLYTIVTVDSPEDHPDTPNESVRKSIEEISLADDLSPDQGELFREMLLSHFPVISTSDEDVGKSASTPIKIKLHDETPIYQRPRRFSPPVTEAIEQQCQELCRLEIIEPSISPWSSPVVPVVKPDKSIRLCVDYRKLNKVTVCDKFPMPNLVDSVFSLHGIQYFTSLDLVRGYYQLPLDENSKELTAFSTPFGHWQFRRLSFGLKNAPAVFQREMQRILTEFPKCKVIIYIDDVLILGRTFEEHLKLVDRVLMVFQEHGLKIKLRKCHWAQAEVKFLGHIVTRTGIRKSPEYVQKVKDFPRPTTVKELRGFLGLVNFQRKFIPKCSAISKPLSRLTGGGKSQGSKKILWNDEMDQAFHKLKGLLEQEVLLSYPDYSANAEPLELYVDASGEGAGACLCQIQNNERTVIAYDSMTFLDYETRYSTIERELAALRWGVKTFRVFLYGQFFHIYSDHRPLMYLQDMKMVDSRLCRTLEELSEYDFVVKYCPGEQNTAADWLSRLPSLPDRALVVDESYLQLPADLMIIERIKGGPDSLIESLVLGLSSLYEEFNKDVTSIPPVFKFREVIVNQFLKDSSRLGFKLDKASRNRIRAMKYPGCVPALELLLSVSKCFEVEIWVHYGPTCPVVYCDPVLKNVPRLHIQCLGGVHFNPVYEQRNFIPPTEVAVGGKVLASKPLDVQDLVEELDQPTVPEILYTIRNDNDLSSICICSHTSRHSARCQVIVNGVTCCALVDLGAQISLIREDAVDKLSLRSFIDDTELNSLRGIAGQRSEILGGIRLGVEFLSGWRLSEYPYAIVSAQSIDFCFVFGKNILNWAELSVNFSQEKVYHRDNFVVSLNDGPASVPNDDSEHKIVHMVTTEVDPDCSMISLDQLREVQASHRQLQSIVKLVSSGVPVSKIPHFLNKFKRVWSDFKVCDGLLFKKESTGNLVGVITFNFLVSLVMDAHLHQSHIGIFKLTALLRKFVWHQSLSKVVRDVCRTCSICQTCKVSSQVTVPPTLRITTNSPFELVAMDLVSLPTTSSGYVGCLMMVDHFTKWVVSIPIRNKKSLTICRALERNILPNVPRVPVRILTDNGPEFTSQEFTLMMERFNIVHVRSTPYKPSSNGAVERVNRTIGELLRVLNDEPRKWDEDLAHALLTYNHTVHSETGATPAEMILKLSHDVDSVPLLSAEIKDPWAVGHPRYHPFSVGTLVLRKSVLLGNLTTNKLVPRFDGPYQVCKVNSNKVTYKLSNLEEDTVLKAHHVQLKPWLEPPFYLKRHVKFYGNVDLDPAAVSDNETPAYPTPSIVEENVISSSDDDAPNMPIALMAQFLKYRSKETLAPVIIEPSKPLKSILKPPRTYEERRLVKMLEEHDVLDETPVLEATMFSSEVQHSSSDVVASSFIDDEICRLVFDWNVSSIVSEDNSSASLSDDSFQEVSNSYLLENLFQSPANPFRDDNGSLKEREQIQTEVNLIEGLYNLNYAQLSQQLWDQASGDQTSDHESDIVISPPEGHEFSGFSVLPSTPTGRSSGWMDPVVRNRQLLQDKLTALREGETSLSSSASRRVSLSPVLSEIREARQIIEQNRVRSRNRAIQLRRRLSFSPPFTRSQGEAASLPNVQDHVLEWSGKCGRK